MSPSNKNLPPISFQELGILMPENNLAELDATAINKYLQALFLLRATLQESWGESSKDLAAFDIVLSSALMIVIERRGVLKLMRDAQLLGWVKNGADLLPLIATRLRAFF